VERPHIDNGTPAILTVSEAKKALEFTRKKMPRFLAWLTLAMMAGIRPEEIDKLTPEKINLDQGIVTVDALTSKVRRRRIVHLKPAAIAWLKTARIKKNLPLPHVTRRRCLRKLRDALGWPEWKKDVLRHTAASYWLASEPDAARLAMELGNSQQVLMKHYRELVTDEQAKAFWALMPKKARRM
jgi:integrase